MDTKYVNFIHSIPSQMDELISSYLLVIEDEPIIRGKILKKLAAFIDIERIKFAANLQDSFNLLNTYEFKVIILDLNLSDGNGIEILNKSKEYPLEPLIYVFSINSELKRICLKKGADAFFDKSKDFDKLISTIKSNYSGNALTTSLN